MKWFYYTTFRVLSTPVRLEGYIGYIGSHTYIRRTDKLYYVL